MKKLSKTLLCLSLFWSSQALAQRVGDFCMDNTVTAQMPVELIASAEVNVVDEVFDDSFETPDP